MALNERNCPHYEGHFATEVRLESIVWNTRAL